MRHNRRRQRRQDHPATQPSLSAEPRLPSELHEEFGNAALELGRRFGLGARELEIAESSLGGAQRIAPSLGERSGDFVSAANDGFVDSLKVLDGGRISVAAMGVGLAQGAYDLAYAYAQERHQFGRPIARFQAVAFKLADMAVEIEAGRQLVTKAAWLKDQGRPFALEAAMAKLYTGELSHRVVNQALQIHGGYGFMDEFAISRLYRDQKILEIGEGTNEVQRMVIARQLGL